MLNKTFDLFVIGGGINGAAIACDAAGRGVTTGIAEARDFGEGTSSRSSKLIHGGLRYLETYDFKLVRDALKEREILMAKMPHLVTPLRLVLPHVKSQRPLWMIRIGLFLYDHLAKRKILKNSKTLKLSRHKYGKALKESFNRGFVYSDCRGDDARLVITNLLGAKAHGAKLFPRHRFISAKRENTHWKIEIENTLNSSRFFIQSKALVNAAGPWVLEVSQKISNIKNNCRLRMVRGSHIVVPRLWDGDHGYFLQTSDGRLMEAFPYEENFTSIGTTDEPWEEAPEKVKISDKEIDYLLSETNKFLKKKVEKKDIVWKYSGVRPLFESGTDRDTDLSTLTRDYSFEIDHEGGALPLMTVFGGKLTTHRKLAMHALKRLEKFLSFKNGSQTKTEVLPGGSIGEGMSSFLNDMQRAYPWLPEKLCNRYARTYGSRMKLLLGESKSIVDLGRCFGADLYEKEVEFLVKEEWAHSSDDILWRRTKMGLKLGSERQEDLTLFLKNRHAVVDPIL